MTETITIPGYSITRKLGQGGMASVYLAVQQSFGRDVALKVMSPLLNSDPTFAARFKREARIVAQLSHASIVPVFEVGEHDSCHYLSMEYLSGGDLKHRLLNGERDLDLALNVCTALGAALDVAHRKGFVHRDIKPENILFREDGTPVLTDFGIARAVDSGRSMTLAGMLVGTPDYMSPEQVKGLELDGRSDLYSLGIVFYEVVTGAMPFKADSHLSVALKQVGEPLPALPSEFAVYQEFLDCLTAKDREQRFASGAEVARALRVIGTGRTVRSRALARAATMPGVTLTGPVTQADVPVAPTPPPVPDRYASQPTLARPRVSTNAALFVLEPTARPAGSTNPPRPAETPQPPADPPRADDVSPTNAQATSTLVISTPTTGTPATSTVATSTPATNTRGVGTKGGASQRIKTFALRSQPLWMSAAALAALLVGVALIVGGFRKSSQPSSAAPPVETASVVDTAAQSPPQSTVPATTQQATQTAPPAVANAAPVGAPASAAPTSDASTSATPSSPSPGTATPGPDVAQSAGPAVPATVTANADANRAQAEATAARRKRLSEERRQRKEEEANRLAQEAADLRAEQLKAQETRIQQMLVEAKNEYAAGALWKPAGANAADNYRAILKMEPDRGEALAGAQRVANVLAAEAAQAESVGDVYNAKLLIDQIQSLQPDHPKLAGLQTKLVQLESAPTSPDAMARDRLSRAAKLMAKAEEDLGHNPLDYRAVDDATGQYDKAVSTAPMAPGLPLLQERLIGAYATAIQTEINNHDPKRAHKLVNTAHKRKWTSDALDQAEASLQAAEAAPAAAPTAAIKEAGASDDSTH